jgi:hypothetical protein
MASPDFFLRSLLRVASLQGRGVLEAIVTSQFSAVSTNGGKQLTGATANGKSFSYTVPAGLSLLEVMARMEEALEWIDSHTSDELTAILSTKAATYTTARFR